MRCVKIQGIYPVWALHMLMPDRLTCSERFTVFGACRRMYGTYMRAWILNTGELLRVFRLREYTLATVNDTARVWRATSVQMLCVHQRKKNTHIRTLLRSSRSPLSLLWSGEIIAAEKAKEGETTTTATTMTMTTTTTTELPRRDGTGVTCYYRGQPPPTEQTDCSGCCVLDTLNTHVHTHIIYFNAP